MRGRAAGLIPAVWLRTAGINPAARKRVHYFCDLQ
jgi:hypothetical protein